MSDAFQRLDVDDKGYLDEATAIKATQQSENQPYDVVRQALKEVELDSSRRVELEDYVSVCSNASSRPSIKHDTDSLIASSLLSSVTPHPLRSACLRDQLLLEAVVSSRSALEAILPRAA